MSRVRTACPSCECLSITKRSRIGGYKCKSCKAEFTIPIEVVVSISSRMAYMREYRRTHKEATGQWEAANRERRA